jgi:SET family sugar efflux transporter-like MFS transporter
VTRIRQWLPLALVFLTVGLATAMSFPFLALFLTTGVHASPVQVTIYLVASPLASVVLSTLLGRLADRHSARRRVLLGTALAGCAGLAVTSVVRDYWLLLLVAVTLTASAFAMMPQAFAYARAVLGGAAMTMSALRTLFSLAWVAGPPLAALLLTAGGFRGVYGFGAAMYALAAVVIVVGMPEPAPAAATPSGPADRPRATTPRAMWWTVGAFVALQCATGIGVQALSLFIRDDLGGGVRDAGLLLGLCAGLEIPLMLGLGALAARWPLRRLILAGPLFAVGYFVLAASATHIWQLGAGQLLNAASIAAVQGLGITYVQDLMPDQPGRASALYSNAFPAGAIIAGPVLGVAGHLGYRFAYIAAAGLAVGGFVLLRAGSMVRRVGPGPSPVPAGAAPSVPAGAAPAVHDPCGPAPAVSVP